MKKLIYPINLQAIFLTIFLITSSTLIAQDWKYYDSLRVESQNKKDLDSAILYSEKALQSVKEQIGESDSLYAFMLSMAWKAQFAKSNYLNAIELAEIEKVSRANILGKSHPTYAELLNNLAILYYYNGNYPMAEKYYTEAKDIRKEFLGEKHPDYASVLNNLAIIKKNTDKYAEAEQLYLEALEIRKDFYGELIFFIPKL
ncbi:MAG: tetratricopeptide repeat protein [Bacteroidetes bacterium]|nr:tetratricopeptide repeat protein [Bacteroidota bacterium]